MKLKQIVMICVAVAAASLSFGQSATLVADKPSAAAGSEFTLTASAYYPGVPSALGWSVTLPEGWTYVSTGGANPPSVGPQNGATGTLEWAYTDVPAGSVQFSFTVRATGKAGIVQLRAQALLRADGKQQAVDAAPVSVSIAP